VEWEDLVIAISRRRASFVIAFFAVAVVATGCGGTSPATPLPEAQAGQMYLSDLAPVHSAVAAFLTVTTTWNLTTTRAQATADAAPLMAAIRTFDSELSSTPWPANASADVQTLITEDKVIIADLTGLDVITHATVGAWEVNIAADTDVDASDSNLVRSDLGLPQATLPA
jgi:hypothetical protein